MSEVRCRRGPRRAAVLLVALFLMVVLFFAGVTFHRLLPTELHAFNAIHGDLQASLVARAGADYLLSSLEGDLRPKISEGGRLGEWSWKGAASHERGKLEFEVDAFDQKRIRRARLRALAEPSSFARWTLAVNRQSAVATFDPSSPSIEGRVHFNSSLRIRGVGDDFYQRRQALFLGRVSVSDSVADQQKGDGVRYARLDGRGWSPENRRPYDTDGNVIPERYEKLFAGGRSDLNVGVRTLSFPDRFESLLEETTQGGQPRGEVWLATHGERLEGGLYLDASLAQVRLSSEAGGRSLWWETVAGRRYRLVEALFGDLADVEGQRLAQGSSALITYLDAGAPQVKIYEGLTNGLVYVDGDIGRLRGVNRGARTLVCKGKVVVSSDISRTDLINFGEASASPGDNFGLVAETMEVRYPRRSDQRVLYGCYYLNPGGLVVTSQRPGRVTLRVVGGLHCAEIGSDSAVGDLQLRIVEDRHQSQQPPPEYPTTDRFHFVDWDLSFDDL